MADTKITDLTEKTTPEGSDNIVIVNSISGLDNQTSLYDLPLTPDLGSSLATRANNRGDSLTNQYFIQNTGLVPTLTFANIKPAEQAWLQLVDDNNVNTSNIQMLGSSATYGSIGVGGDQIFENISGDIALKMDKVKGFHLVETGVETASLINGEFNCTTIDPTQLNLNGLTYDPSVITTDELMIYDVAASSNKKITVGSLPTSTAFTARMTGTPKSLYTDYTSVSITGSPSELTLRSFLVPANTFNANDLINFKTLLFTKTGVAGATSIRIRTNTTNTLVGSTQLSIASTTGGLAISVTRKFHLASGLLYGIVPTTSFFTDVGTSSAFISTSFNPAVDNYFFITVQNVSTADTMACIAVEVDKE